MKHAFWSKTDLAKLGRVGNSAAMFKADFRWAHDRTSEQRADTLLPNRHGQPGNRHRHRPGL